MSSTLTALDDALALLQKAAPLITQSEDVPVKEAMGRVLAAPVFAPYALPRFTNTGVDGYAIVHDTALKAWAIIGASYAGASYTGRVGPAQAVRIATGAMLPEGADTVVMQEDCIVDEKTLTITTLPARGSCIRKAGADIQAGALAIPALSTLQPQDLALLCALNITSVKVLRPLRVAVASSGHELAAAGDSLAPGQIIDSNSQMLSQVLGNAGVSIDILPPLPDNYEETLTCLKDAAGRYDLVVTTGGVSVGDRDCIRDAMHALNTPIFWKLALRPGKPVLAVKSGDCLMIGLPGNPVSAFVTAIVIIRPVMAAFYGLPMTLPHAYEIKLAQPINKPAHLRVFARAAHTDSGLVPYPDQGSNLYTSLTHASGLIDLPLGPTAYEAGDTVLFRPFKGLL